MITVRASSRVHFGLLGLPSKTGRQYGGAGLMVEHPGLQISVQPASTWSATGPCAERALNLGQRLVQELRFEEPHAFGLKIDYCAPEHAGLGTGTQLALAVARGICNCLDCDLSIMDLAPMLGRGRRSGVGVNGFDVGGFLVDGGKGSATTVAPLIVRESFADAWRILLLVPKNLRGEHGSREREAFAHLAEGDDSSLTDELCRLLLLGVLPALIERDLPAFGESIYELNRRVGEMFRPWQGGIYSHPQTAALIEGLRGLGIKGVGQSSWGPAVFAIDMEDRLRDAVARLQSHLGLAEHEVIITREANDGATVTAS